MQWLRTQLAAIRRLSLISFLSSLLQTFGVLWLVVESGTFFHLKFAETARNFWWVFLIVGAVVGLWRAWPRLSVKFLVSGTDSIVEICICDLFSLPGAVVFGSNTTFDTSIEDGTISEASIQGQFTRLYCDSVENLDRQIEDSLKGTDCEMRAATEKPYGKRKEYKIGTVASVSSSGKRAYMLAIATLNVHRVTSATREDILDALPLLWEFIRIRGGLEPLSCPILGSGYSRLNAQREMLIREIVKSFVAASRVGRFCEHLTISIAPEDFQRGNINLESLGRFLEHECTYSSSREPSPRNTPRGTPASPRGDSV